MTVVTESGRAPRHTPEISQRRLWITAAQVGFAAAVILAWGVASGRFVSSAWVSDPVSVTRRIVEWVTGGFIYPHLWATVKNALIGLVVGVGLGVLCGLVLGRLTVAARVLDPFILALYSIPQIAMFPFFVLWLGIGNGPKLALVISLVFFPLYFNTIVGVRATDRDLVAAVRVMGASRLQLMRYAIIPSLGAYVTAGIAVAVPLALLGAILGDMLVGSKGLGFVIVNASNTYDSTGVLAGAVIVMLLGLLSVQLIAKRGVLFMWRDRRSRAAHRALLESAAATANSGAPTPPATR
jgi:NitT/TauT family transport system permease protein